MMTIVFKAQTEMATSGMKLTTKPLSVECCAYNFTVLNDINSSNFSDDFVPSQAQFYQMSYLYYSLVGSMIVVIASFALSFVFGFQDPNEVDSKLLAPFMRKKVGSSMKEESFLNGEGKEVVVHSFELKENLSSD